jgi:hypothetical protein
VPGSFLTGKREDHYAGREINAPALTAFEKMNARSLADGCTSRLSRIVLVIYDQLRRLKVRSCSTSYG